MAPRSKRARKAKDALSCRGKRAAVDRAGDGGDDAEPAAAHADAPVDSNAAILPARAKKSKLDGDAAAAAGDAAAPRKLTKAQARKARRVAEEKAAREARAQVYATLQQHALPDAARTLLRGAGTLGQRETKKERLKRELAEARLGLAPRADGLLLRRRRSVDEDEDSESDASGSGSESEEEEVAVAAPPAARRSPSPSSASPTPPPPARALSPASLRAAVSAARAELGLPPPGQAPPAAPPQPDRPPPSTTPLRPVFFARPPAMEAARADLPIVGMEQEIMEAVRENDVLLLGGETGCGKTTQVPQFLMEAGYGSPAHPRTAGAIAVTQPRRVAAVAAAARVAAELGTAVGGSLVGHRVRHAARARADTRCVFMTDGVLLRELGTDFLLARYSAIVLDEAHERSVATDLLLGLLSRVARLRARMAADAASAPTGTPSITPLKLIIMSATLRVADFADNRALFSAPPASISVPARQYPVTIHFARVTERDDYARVAVAKVCALHRSAAPGGILLFLTGRREVEWAVRRLQAAFGGGKKGRARGGKREDETVADADDDDDDDDDDDAGALSGGDEAEAADGAGDASESDRGSDDFDDDALLSDEDDTVTLGGGGDGAGGVTYTPDQLAAAAAAFEARTGMALPVAAPGAAARPTTTADPAARPPPPPVHVLPLYAALPAAAQARVFEPPPPGHRLIVVATNVAETSLTLPGVRYVVDAGRAKVRTLREHGAESGLGGPAVARYQVGWISKASAAQRAGRAGRVCAGVAYRLYSSAVYENEFEEAAPPALDGAPLEGVLLTLRALGVDRPAAFPFPSAPPRAALAAGDAVLAALGAVDATASPPVVTPLGAAMAALPISPRHARALVEVVTAVAAARAPPAALAAALALAAAVSVETPFESAPGGGTAAADDPAAAKAARAAARAAAAALTDDSSDALSALAALAAYEARPPATRDAWAASSGVSARRLAEAAALRRQLAAIVRALARDASCRVFADVPPAALAGLADPPPTKLSAATRAALRRALAAGWADRVARRVRAAPAAAAGPARRAIRYAVATAGADGDDGQGAASAVHVHPSSALARRAPEWICYTDLVATDARTYVSGATAIDPAWLAAVAPALVTVTLPPAAAAAAAYDAAADEVRTLAAATYGPRAWPLPPRAVKHPDARARVATFAAALLSGAALGAMKAAAACLVAPPATAADPAAAGVRRVGDLLAALASRRVDCVRALAAAWATDAGFLEAEVGAWAVPGGRATVAAALAAARAEAAARRVEV